MDFVWFLLRILYHYHLKQHMLLIQIQALVLVLALVLVVGLVVILLVLILVAIYNLQQLMVLAVVLLAVCGILQEDNQKIILQLLIIFQIHILILDQ